MSSTVQMGNYTSYPSAFLVVDPDGVYSKHYYAGAQRIAARVGEESADRLFREDSEGFCSGRSAGRTADEHKKLQQDDLQHYLEKGEIKTKLSFKEYKPVVDKEEEETTSTSDTSESYADRPTDQIYYYHPDHLGTATFLTDGNGLPYEFFLNLPFGETMAEQHSQTADYENRWKFTGHELDRETGLYYAGARYYDPKISIWLSVDPLAEKFPSWNPYNYVMQNPINLSDPTGMEPYSGDPPKRRSTTYSINEIAQRNDSGQIIVVSQEKKTYEKKLLGTGSQPGAPVIYIIKEISGTTPLQNSPIYTSRTISGSKSKPFEVPFEINTNKISNFENIKTLAESVKRSGEVINIYGQTLVSENTVGDGIIDGESRSNTGKELAIFRQEAILNTLLEYGVPRDQIQTVEPLYDQNTTSSYIAVQGTEPNLKSVNINKDQIIIE